MLNKASGPGYLPHVPAGVRLRSLPFTYRKRHRDGLVGHLVCSLITPGQSKSKAHCSQIWLINQILRSGEFLRCSQKGDLLRRAACPANYKIDIDRELVVHDAPRTCVATADPASYFG